MGKQNDKLAALSEQTNSDSIQRIREIIFGEYIHSWENNFKRLEKKIGDLNKKIDTIHAELKSESVGRVEELSQSKKELKSEIKKLQTEMTNKLKKLDDSKVDKDSIGEVFIQWGQQVKAKK